MAEIDPRIVRVGIEVDGRLRVYEGLSIVISGTKFANANQDEATIKICGLEKSVRDYLVTQTSPFVKTRTPKEVIVWAGRASYGVTQIYRGSIVSASVSQPPDIWTELKAQTGAAAALKIIVQSQPENTKLSQIARQIAKDLDANLSFEAVDKFVKNYMHSGAATKQIDRLEDCGDVNVYLDGNNLVVKDKNVPLSGKVRILNIDTGMIGVPQFNEWGVKVSMLLDNQTVIGGALDIRSKLYPAANGKYAIYKLGFEIASRDTPFYYHAEAVRIPD